ncbi:FAD-binding oxidoreductase [Hellea balneolensis]|uniref:FAD-binding oxidoreductase n=1 Tax=Hellea balneolensis TaxID=287478 RepID=UPI00042314E6|nr:FAD-binding oxidoreductase [Hellea balneolensis]
MKPVLSWGRINDKYCNVVRADYFADPNLLTIAESSDNGMLLAHGMGRSYGDSGLNKGGVIFQTTRQNHILDFDTQTGIIKARAGITLEEILRVSVPQGWFLPVTPGTKYVTLGGAVANDVHGKNHHKVGSLGAHIMRLSLTRSDRKTVICSPRTQKKLFNMTIGGLGLTGFINWVEFKLKPIESSYLETENIPYTSLDEFFSLSEESAKWPYTVAWIDCFAPKSKQGRGIFTRAKFSNYGALDIHRDDHIATWPFVTPALFLNRFSITAFNFLYRWRPGARMKGRSHYDSFFYPLDGINHWNRLYGKAGFFQHQSLIPLERSKEGIGDLLDIIKESKQGSFLAVLKLHGPEYSPGTMSFCRPGKGVSLALDFANKGQKTRQLLERLDACVLKHNGRTYPAKDGRMSAQTFQTAFPQWTKLEAMRDPKFSSSFWRRVSQTTS